jgi:hypothetical protein
VSGQLRIVSQEPTAPGEHMGYWTVRSPRTRKPSSWHETPADATAAAFNSARRSGGGTVKRIARDGSARRWAVAADGKVRELAAAA